MNDHEQTKRNNVRQAFLFGTALATMFAEPAFAQDAPKKADDEIVVTATHRSESILDVPYNITAVSGQQIEEAHMRDSTELLRSIPGVSVVDRGERNATVVNGVRGHRIVTERCAVDIGTTNRFDVLRTRLSQGGVEVG